MKELFLRQKLFGLIETKENRSKKRLLRNILIKKEKWNKIKSPKVLLIHPGTQHAPRLAEELDKSKALMRFWTGWAQPGQRNGKRSVLIPREKLKRKPWLEILSILISRAGYRSENLWFIRNKVFQQLIPDREIYSADLIVGFDTASHILAQRARQAGKLFVLEQSTLDPEAKENSLRRMSARYPEWACQVEKRSTKLLLAEQEEHRLAERISVPSDYVACSLVKNGIPTQKIYVNAYGTNPIPKSTILKKKIEKNNIKILFAGNVSGRKGVPLLLEAWARLKNEKARLTIAGDMNGWPAKVKRPANIRFTGLLTKKELAEAFIESDVFVFPSYVEGMPLVVLEAMSFGLPVIGTPVVEGLVQNGVNGQIVPCDDPLKLAEAMQGMLTNPAKIVQMGDAARERAGQFTWQGYGDRYLQLIEDLLKKQSSPVGGK